MSVTIPVSSREYVIVPNVNAFDPAGEQADPTDLPVEVALTDVGDAPESWTAAEWVPNATTPTARILVGAGGTLEPAAGTYSLWLRVTGAVEQPTRPVGRIRVV